MKTGIQTATHAIGCIILSLVLVNVTWADDAYDEGMRFKQQENFPAAAQAFRQALASDAQNRQALEQLAIVESWQNHFDTSIAAWRQLLQLTPAAPAAHLGLARVLYWKAQRSESLREIDVALAMNPNNVDALVLKGDVLLADGKISPARAAYEQAQSLAKNDADIGKKIARTESANGWRIDAGYISDHYSALRGSESSSYAQIGKQISNDTSLYLRGDRYDNFSHIDIGLSPGGYFKLSPWYLLNAEVGFNVDNPNFRPKQMATFNSEFLIDGVFQPLLGLRYMHYEAGVISGSQTPSVGGNVSTITPGVRILMGATNLELRYGISKNLDDSSTGVFQAKLSFERDGYSPYLVYADGEEALPPLDKASVRVFGAGCVFNFNAAWGARIDYSHEDRSGFYTHDAIGLGVSRHF